jgi:hypothetical protein
MEMSLHKTAPRFTRDACKKNGKAPQRPKGDLQDRVYAELRRWIMVGRFLPGEAITLRNLASELGVSPMPVRGAASPHRRRRHRSAA